jgi:NAD(P)H-dependent flavin oxidoreductase YrpB (nitropropane dioxygenase family)
MAVSLRTKLCADLGITYPIFSAAIGSGAGPELVAAVSNAGGFGVLGARGMTLDDLRQAIERTRGLTGRPFGVNFIIDEVGWATTDEQRLFVRESVHTAIAEKVAAVVFFWGDAGVYVADAHEHGVKVLIQVGSLDEAEAAAEVKVDAVIAQGIEAGGHVKGTTSIWDLLPETVAALGPLPVLASGGIGDGKGVARAMRLGAQGVSLGTRFVASDEAYVHAEYKRRIVTSSGADTVYTHDLYDVGWWGAPHRTLRNRTFDEWEAAGRPSPGTRPGEGTSIGTQLFASGETQAWSRYARGVVTPGFAGDVDYAPMWAGESCSVVNDVKPAAEIVRDLIRDAEIDLASSK